MDLISAGSWRRLAATLASLGLVLFASSAVLAQSKSITIAAEDDWPPYSSAKADKSGPEGMTPDLVRAIFKTRGIEVKYLVVPFSRCLHLVKTGKVVACFNTSITEENKNEFLWHPTPLFFSGTSIFALSESGSPKQALKAQELEGQTVGVTAGYTYPAEFRTNPKIKFTEASSDELLLKMLMAKRVKYAVLSNLPGLVRIKNDPKLAGHIALVGELSKDGMWLNFSKSHPEGKDMAAVFESALLDFKSSGAYDKFMTDFYQRLGLPR